MVDIKTNLLKNHRTLSEKDYRKEKNILKWAIVSLVMTGVIVVALSIWNIVLVAKLTGIEKDITSTSKDMQGLVQINSMQLYLKSRLQLITGFLAGRTVTREVLQKIFSTNIPGAHISSVSFESDKILAVTYLSDSIFTLKDLLNYYTNDTGYFTQTVSRGLSRQKDGTYQLLLALTLPKESK